MDLEAWEVICCETQPFSQNMQEIPFFFFSKDPILKEDCYPSGWIAYKLCFQRKEKTLCLLGVYGVYLTNTYTHRGFMHGYTYICIHIDTDI